MNGGAFLVGVLAGAVRAQRTQRRSVLRPWVPRGPAEPSEEDRRLEEAANAQHVAPIQPPLAVASRITAADGGFTFGAPSGFGPLPPPMLERWIATTGPSLATLADLGASAVPMLISANDRGTVDPDLDRALWRLTTDLRDQVARSAAQQGSMHMTRGPQPILVDGARGICFAATAREGGDDIPNWFALIARAGSLVEVTMQTQAPVEERYIPVWWTVLGSWRWTGRKAVAAADRPGERAGTGATQPPSVADGWDVLPSS